MTVGTLTSWKPGMFPVWKTGRYKLSEVRSRRWRHGGLFRVFGGFSISQLRPDGKPLGLLFWGAASGDTSTLRGVTVVED